MHGCVHVQKGASVRGKSESGAVRNASRLNPASEWADTHQAIAHNRLTQAEKAGQSQQHDRQGHRLFLIPPPLPELLPFAQLVCLSLHPIIRERSKEKYGHNQSPVGI